MAQRQILDSTDANAQCRRNGTYSIVDESSLNLTRDVLYVLVLHLPCEFAMIKRNQGEALRSKTYWAQNREMMLKVLTHNIAIILLVNELFYRAYRTFLISPC